MGYWQGRKVFITGHTGFKGGWLTLWLESLGAQVTGYALPPPTRPSLFEQARIGTRVRSIVGDIRDFAALHQAYGEARPDVVFHLAAQPLVRRSYADPVETFSTNVMGTVHLLEAIRISGRACTVVNVTSDKCYENREWAWGYREHEAMGGHDPYSSSKGCAELVTAAYRRSYFGAERPPQAAVALASARAGNVIGGGDWADDRLIPDCVRHLGARRPIPIRNPGAVRPWQHVLDPLRGYLVLAERLAECGSSAGGAYAQAWNFGPLDSEVQPVSSVVEEFIRCWGGGASWKTLTEEGVHEAHVLKLDSSLARMKLGWRPRLALRESVRLAAEWYLRTAEGEDAAVVTREHISRYEKLAPEESAS